MSARATSVTLAGIAALALAPAAARAQLDDRTIVNVLRECRKIADTTARVACYENIPLDDEAREPPRAAAANGPAPRGFGSHQLPSAPPARAPDAERISARVAGAEERQPGVHRLTLGDGTQWQFVDAAPASYEPPRRGSTVEIIGASMGSYLLRYAGQRSLRIRRVR